MKPMDSLADLEAAGYAGDELLEEIVRRGIARDVAEAALMVSVERGEGGDVIAVD
jgi:hypothetical protein